MSFLIRLDEKFFLKIFSFLVFLNFNACDDKKVVHLSSISISNIKNNDTIYEVVKIDTDIESEASILKTALWINGVKTNVENSSAPYNLLWNTNSFDDGEIEIKVSLYENNGDEIFSSPLKVIIDNTLAVPVASQFDKFESLNGGIQIYWQKAKIGDFLKYKLEKATDSTLTNFDLIKEETNILDTTYFYPNVNKLVNQYFLLTTIDTFNYQSQSEVALFQKDSIPNRIDIISVNYDTTKLIIKWSKSNEQDFLSYSLLHSESIGSQREIIEKIYNEVDTTYTLYDFNPNYLMYFWVEVQDTIGQVRLSSPATYNINLPPSKVTIFPITYNLDSLKISWEPSLEDDFDSYVILKSNSQFSGYSEFETLIDKSYESIIINDFDPTIENWFKIRVNDYWGLSSDSDPISNEVDLIPSPIEIESITYDLDSLTIVWSLFQDDDFYSYELYHSVNDTNDFNLICTIQDINNQSHSIQTFDPRIQNWFKVKVTDFWGLTNFSPLASNQVDMPPIKSEFEYIQYNNGSLEFLWSKNNEFDFESYQIYKSSTENFTDSTLVASFNNRNDTTYNLSISQGNLDYYKLQVTDFWNQTSMSGPTQGNSYTTFIQTYGGSHVDYGKSVIQTFNKDYVVCGTTNSEGSGSSDIFVLKADSLGVEQWLVTFGGFNVDIGTQIIKDNNGGYVILGTTQSFGNVLGNIFLVKIDENGLEEWSNTYGGIELENGNSIYQVNNGYIIAGSSESFGEGKKDVYVLKINFQGDEVWTKTFGTFRNEYAQSIIPSIDEGVYILANYEQLNTENIYDIVVIKLNSIGELEWEERIGGVGNDLGSSIIDIGDGLLLSGNTTSYGNGLSDAYFIKIDYSGVIIWENTFGSNLIEKVSSSISVENNAFIFVGFQESSVSFEGHNIWLGKINLDGEMEWSRNYGGNFADYGYDISQALDEGLIITGEWGGDIFLLKTDRIGAISNY